MGSESREFKNSIYSQLARIGKSLSNPRRLEILDYLMEGEKTVESIANEIGISVASASQHLQVLFDSKLVSFDKDGLYSYYHLTDESISNLLLSLQLVGENIILEIKAIIDEVYSKNEKIEHITTEELFSKMKEENTTIIDVRPKSEYDKCHIPGATSIPLEELEESIQKLPDNHEIVAYCRGRYCLLSVKAVEILKSKGYDAVRLEESVNYWTCQTKN